ncbi:MAG: S8 family serine peptidase, partial [Anaerolineales bacterium]
MRIRPILIFLIAILLAFAGLGSLPTVLAAPGSDSGAAIIPGEVVVIAKPGYAASMLGFPAGTSVAHSSPQLDHLHAVVLHVPAGQERDYALQLQANRGVEDAEPNYVVTTEALPTPIIPNDPSWSEQYGPNHIQAGEAWTVTTGSANVILAIIDSGIDASHPEFAGRLVPGYDFVEGDSTPQDTCGHGTHVAGIAAASGNNGMGVAGIDWNAKIMPVRVLNGYCSGSTADVAEGLVWAVERGARVINLSLGTSAASTLLEDASYYAYSHGAAIFAAAGNSDISPISYPAAYPWVMAVGATDTSDQRASFSSKGAALDLMAPGINIFSTTPLESFYYQSLFGTTKEYGYLTGTSMAAAFASGAGSLLASEPQFNTPDKIYQALTSTALDLDVPGRDNNTGFGLIQLYAALTFTPTITPTPNPTPASSYDILNSKTCGNLVQYNWLDAVPAKNWLPVFGNDGYATVALPFDFTFGDQTYSSITVSANGYVTFGGNGSIRDNFFIPGIGQPNNFLAPYWDDLNPSAGGLMYQQTFGAAPNRQYVVEWDGVPLNGYQSSEKQRTDYSSLTFEVVLYEGSNQALFQYKTLTGDLADGSSATIGVEYGDGMFGKEYSYNQSGAIVPGQALLFVPYASGDTPPSNSCGTYTRPVDGTGGFFDSYPFCIEFASGAVAHPATLQIQNLKTAPAGPSGFSSLNRFADITLSFSPPPPLSLLPEATVCYHYSDGDLLRAGGHPENLFLAAYDSTRRAWDILPTAANTAQSLLSAQAPHLSIYGVFIPSAPASLPVTGAPLRLDTLETASLLGGAGLLLGVYIVS